MNYVAIIAMMLILAIPMLSGEVRLPDQIQADELGKFMGSWFSFWKGLIESAISTFRS